MLIVHGSCFLGIFYSRMSICNLKSSKKWYAYIDHLFFLGQINSFMHAVKLSQVSSCISG